MSLTEAAEVLVEGIASGGSGVGALPSGKVVFIPRTAPGDRVLVRVVKEKARWAQAEAVSWLTAGPHRRDPPCPLFPVCDGCSLQHMEYSQQLAWKSRIVGDTLRRVGGVDVADPPVEASPLELGYRNKVTFTLRRLTGGRVVAGFRELGQGGRVLDVGSECLLPQMSLRETWGTLRDRWGPGASLLPEGRELRLSLQAGEPGAGLTIRGGHGTARPDTLMDLVPGLAAIWWERKGKSRTHLAGEARVTIPLGDESIEAAGEGFVQVNPGAVEALHDYVLREAGEVEGRNLVYAYCGAGILGWRLARMGARVVGIDVNPGGWVAGDSSVSGSFQVLKGRVEDELETQLPADLLLLNPPRAGLAREIPGLLSRIPPARVLYVSCDPATLARDLQRLDGVLVLDDVRSFDLFPQTAHVETVASLKRRGETKS